LQLVVWIPGERRDPCGDAAGFVHPDDQMAAGRIRKRRYVFKEFPYICVGTPVRVSLIVDEYPLGDGRLNLIEQIPFSNILETDV
jgi:hypothetical protein